MIRLFLLIAICSTSIPTYSQFQLDSCKLSDTTKPVRNGIVIWSHFNSDHIENHSNSITIYSNWDTVFSNTKGEVLQISSTQLVKTVYIFNSDSKETYILSGFSKVNIKVSSKVSKGQFVGLLIGQNSLGSFRLRLQILKGRDFYDQKKLRIILCETKFNCSIKH
jgi:hypothetical protein